MPQEKNINSTISTHSNSNGGGFISSWFFILIFFGVVLVVITNERRIDLGAILLPACFIVFLFVIHLLDSILLRNLFHTFYEVGTKGLRVEYWNWFIKDDFFVDWADIVRVDRAIGIRIRIGSPTRPVFLILVDTRTNTWQRRISRRFGYVYPTALPFTRDHKDYENLLQIVNEKAQQFNEQLVPEYSD